MRGESARRVPASGRGVAPASAPIGPGSAPSIASSMSALSRSVRVIGPGWSWEWLSGRIPRSGSRPRVALMVDVPQMAEGMRREPAVSVPVAAGVVCEASAAPLPPLEPPAPRERSQGLPTWSVLAAGRELVRVQVPEQDHPRVEEPRRDDRVLLGREVGDPARAGERVPGGGVEVLEAERDAAEGRGVARRQALVGARGVGERALGVDADPGVDRVRRALEGVRAVDRLDAREVRVGDLAGGGRALAEERTELDGRAGGEVHVSPPRGASAPRPAPSP